jgi:hypothetical protein
MAAGATAAAMAAKKYTPLEVQRVQGACSLMPAIYEAEILEIFA